MVWTIPPPVDGQLNKKLKIAIRRLPSRDSVPASSLFASDRGRAHNASALNLD
jgi:hypothetical protein